MKKAILFFIVLLLTLSLVSAVDISTDKDEYDQGDIVSVSVSSCTTPSIIEVRNPDNDMADMVSGLSMGYNTLSDSAKGKYSVKVSCTDGEDTKEFCIGSPGCLGTTATTTSPGSSSGGQGGSNACTPQWDCEPWTFCNAQLTQLRTCHDKNNCQPSKTESRPCQQCEESWVCSLWSDCLGSTNTRSCFDEHSCGTDFLKPVLEKSCRIEIPPGPSPIKVSTQLPPPTYSYAPPTPEKSAFQQFWDDYKWFIVSGLAGLILLIIIIIVISKFVKARKSEAINHNELVDWIRKEKQMGTSDEKIKAILSNSTTWRQDEVDKAFNILVKQPVLKPAKKQLPVGPSVKKNA